MRECCSVPGLLDALKDVPTPNEGKRSQQHRCLHLTRNNGESSHQYTILPRMRNTKTGAGRDQRRALRGRFQARDNTVSTRSSRLQKFVLWGGVDIWGGNAGFANGQGARKLELPVKENVLINIGCLLACKTQEKARPPGKDGQSHARPNHRSRHLLGSLAGSKPLQELQGRPTVGAGFETGSRISRRPGRFDPCRGRVGSRWGLRNLMVELDGQRAGALTNLIMAERLPFLGRSAFSPAIVTCHAPHSKSDERA